jgi:hypothetical protein
MKSLVVHVFAFGLTIGSSNLLSAEDWPVWRGPNRNNVAPANQTPPTSWSENKNVIWRAEIPGLGHSSPIVVGERIFLTTSETDSQVQSVICFDRKNGKRLWQTPVNEGGFESRIHPNNTHASPTIVTSDNRLFAVFNNHRSVQLAALDFDGTLLWERNTGPFEPTFQFGFGSSPCVYRDLVIVFSDCPDKGYLAAYRQADGEEVWRAKRGETSSYASPVIATIGGREQLVVSGSDIRGYDPADGRELWKVPGPWKVTCGTPVWDGDRVFVSGGYPTNATLAISTSKQSIIWQNQIKAYEQSLLFHDGYVYCHADSGIAYCWRSSDGKEMWKKRVTGGGVSASPVLVGDLIYLTAENGDSVTIRANPEKFEVIAENKLGGCAFATPVFLDNRMYTRVGNSKGVSPQFLYCIGEK